jgi:hypothetical protein
MKKHLLTLSIRVEVESKLNSLSQTIQEFEQETTFSIGSTENVVVLETEILRTEVFNLNH